MKPRDKTYEVSIIDILKSVDRCDHTFYSKLTEEQQRKLSMWLIMRWSSAVNTKYYMHYLLSVNEIVNTDFQSLKNHPELQWMLMSICGIGVDQRHVFVKPPKGARGDKIDDYLLTIDQSMSSSELELFKTINSNSDLIDHAKDGGMDDSEIKDIFGRSE